MGANEGPVTCGLRFAVCGLRFAGHRGRRCSAHSVSCGFLQSRAVLVRWLCLTTLPAIVKQTGSARPFSAELGQDGPVTYLVLDARSRRHDLSVDGSPVPTSAFHHCAAPDSSSKKRRIGGGCRVRLQGRAAVGPAARAAAGQRQHDQWTVSAQHDGAVSLFGCQRLIDRQLVFQHPHVGVRRIVGMQRLVFGGAQARRVHNRQTAAAGLQHALAGALRTHG